MYIYLFHPALPLNYSVGLDVNGKNLGFASFRSASKL